MLDPRTAPLIGTDRHLPPVPPQRLSGPALRQRFASNPAWQPELARDSRNFVDRPVRHAAVLVPIVLRDAPTVLLTRRTDQLSSHSGQVAFPGGKVDDDDDDAVAAALREAEEEVGLEPRWVEVIGALPDYLTGSAYRITPVVGLVHPAAAFRLNPHEVADLFEVPLTFLMDPAHHQRHVAHWQGQRHEWFAMPYDDAGTERFIWGATAALLRNLYRFLSA
ncbi:CoA pyrophosphatase [Malikia sp.]|uniref:CoA pyrophosphatase n=1 Tax=Malikia sp. TaxID=2070706 RepID=UPI002636CC4B|nr:CoA pyrophosphatase [Malikia sp.]MDD2728876.1 CoA pyrophosphatase [Malikia sp.]